MSEERAQTQIIERLVGRLNDFRSDLGTEEAAILDALIVGRAAEVTGHRFDSGGVDWSIALVDGVTYKVNWD